MIIVVDFGSQTTHLITRRIKEYGASAETVIPKKALRTIMLKEPSGIILSGGPASVYEKDSPQIEKEIFDLGIPILGICYGMQLMSKVHGGRVISGKKEYGPAKLSLKSNTKELIAGKALPANFTVWMSHGDEVKKPFKGAKVLGSTDDVPYAFVGDVKNKLYGVQFHPEVEHTQHGDIILKNFLAICGENVSHVPLSIPTIIKDIKKKVGNNYVIGALSGGVDSTVASVLMAQAIGDKFIPIYVDTGLMRYDTDEHIEKIFSHLKVRPITVKVKTEMLKRLKSLTDPEEKRKTIGKLFIDTFDKEAKKLAREGKDIRFLMQGTIYSDVIESRGTKHSANIKSHHNVGGLPKKMNLKLIEPVRQFYKDEVRKLGTMLGLPQEFVMKQPFPGPGYGVRIRGEVTRERLAAEIKADEIVMEELKNAKILDKVFISFPVMTGAFSTAVKGDGRHFGEVVALRIVESTDVMTATWARIPYDVLQKISSRIVNEIPEVSRVVYDISTKPPATMEWE